MSRERCGGIWLGRAILLPIAAMCLATVAMGQQYRTDPIDPAAKPHGAKQKRWVGDAEAYRSDITNFNDYFQKYYFPAMTRSAPGDLAELGKMRVDLFKKYLWATTNTELQKNLTDMARKAMGKVVMNQQAPPYHPSVRYNAILVIGLLDSEYAVEGGANPRPPKPDPVATKALTRIVDQAATSTQFPPSVVLGALIGLERHAKYHQSLTPDAVTGMSAALQKFVKNEEPIQGMDADAFAWLRLRAASALANLGSLGENNAVHDAIIQLIATSESLDDRCSAAALLGTFKYDQAKIDAPGTTKALFKLTKDLSAEELKRAEDFERNRGVGGYSAPTEFGASGSEVPDDGYPRRHVLARLVSLGAGLKAVKPALPQDSQKQVDAILAATTPVVGAAQDEKTVSLRITDLIRKMDRAIAGVVGGLDDASDEEDFSAGGAAAAPAADPASAPAPADATDGAPASDAPVPTEGAAEPAPGAAE